MAENKKIYSAIAEIMGELSPIAKTQKNSSQGGGYNYRGIDQFYNELGPLFAKHKIFSVPSVLDKKTSVVKSRGGHDLRFVELTMKYTFYAEDGSFVETVVAGEAMDSGDKASNKAMAVAHKYALMQIFTVPTAELDDPDKESHLINFNKPSEQPSPIKPKSEKTISDLKSEIRAFAKAKGRDEEFSAFLKEQYGSDYQFTIEELKQLKSECERLWS